MRLSRLSPKPLFFGMVALGLPFAVTVGWALGDPATTTTPPPAAAPAGAGGLGAAPPNVTTSAPVTAVDYSSRGSRTGPGAPSASAVRPVVVPSVSSAAGSPALPLPLPTLTDPPVPTPTDATSAPPSPSATPSGSPSPEPTGIGLIRRS